MPKVSVIMPLYNKEALLRESIKSVLNQTYNNFELIIINDGSTDLSKNIALEYKKIDDRIKYYEQANQGVSSARNIGIDMSKSEYLTFLDADDKMDKTYLRDEVSADYLKQNLGLTKTNVGTDLAYLDLPNQNAKQLKDSLLNEYSLVENKYFTIVPSGLIQQYTEDKNSYIKSWKNIIEKLLKKKQLEDYKLVLLPHVLRPEVIDDRNVVNEILRTFTGKQKDKLVYINRFLLPSEARLILGNGIFTITGRMHAAVSTFQMIRPAISLSYSMKYEGVIGKNLDMNDLIIEAANTSLWTSGDIVKRISSKVDYVLAKYEELINKIKTGVEKNKQLEMLQLRDLAKKL